MLSLLCLTPFATSAAAECAWVLWRQGLFPGERMQQISLALGAWPSREECEAQKRAADAQKSTSAPYIHACLPDTVNLREQRQ